MAFMEPFRIKMVAHLADITKEERVEALHRRHYNPLQLSDQEINFDLWTDSGAAAMSHQQWAAMLQAHEGSINPDSFDKFEDTIRSITGFPYVFPVHQGRAAEHLLFSMYSKPGLAIFSNTMYSTGKTLANVLGASQKDLPCKRVRGEFFNGNIDCERLEQELSESDIAIVVLTVTSNHQAGQPVSMANIRRTSEICRRYRIPLFMDGCRFEENAYFIKIREKSYGDMSARAIALEMCSYFDGMYLSAKKDAMCSIGGCFATKLLDLREKFDEMVETFEGRRRYGGMAARDLDAVAIGLTEGIEDRYLKYRIESLSTFGDILKKAGVPIVEPVGSAIYINAARCLPHIPTEQYPAWALHCALYIEGGIRCNYLDDALKFDDSNERENPQPHHFLRICLPRRAYTLSHMLHIGEVFEKLLAKRERISGIRIVQRCIGMSKMLLEPVNASLIDIN
ncbi:tryptophanase 1-like [Haliotis asinina]|uniref:tryptophanase 1-like n=1 Tax=Haliotis asinina TaxID=109174 RepID=UPI0035324E9C